MLSLAVSFSELTNRFGTTPQRWALLRGLLAYRNALRAANLQAGFQWLDGSFLEDSERTRGRAPADIDMVTFALLPHGLTAQQFLERHPELLSERLTKLHFGCDAYFVDLGLGARRPHLLVERARYWYGLFSHQRASALRKGMLQIDLFSDDATVAPLFAPKESNDAAQT